MELEDRFAYFCLRRILRRRRYSPMERFKSLLMATTFYYGGCLKGRWRGSILSLSLLPINNLQRHRQNFDGMEAFY